MNTDLLTGVLRCYKPHCRYLTSAKVEVDGEIVRGTGTMRIPESCYIDETGHLNSVEVGICYNQLLYHVIATSVRDRVGPVFSNWSMDDFWRRQLPDILIAKFSSAFHRPIDPRSFQCELTIERTAQRRLQPGADPLISLETSFRCWDDNGGACSGAARVAIVGS
ncbi:FcoT family thioesterase [Amycolatopsis sp. NPDC059657]|uniref:FcoT family thioesterase n=1 Tax=Amycolatopsis sp. NPDC059657 TaxID=3346899 RepID=UPI003672AAF6